ncbi:hypothetical protein AKJ09_01693 [Labilithrix luteola]|uniref:Uncharacterized protein n=1 Tax=Labilithrix luteola TaxID=1391654 RepID=A0A0K1PPI4_9BACT|nr:hypothetical protein AKJ09_01693 [Labilithrix luteola]
MLRGYPACLAELLGGVRAAPAMSSTKVASSPIVWACQPA